MPEPGSEIRPKTIESSPAFPSEISHLVTQNGESTVLGYDRGLDEQMRRVIEKTGQNIKPAPLTVQEREQLQHAEGAAKSFMFQKIKALGGTTDSLEELPPIRYAGGNILQSAGWYDAVGHGITVDVYKSTGHNLTTALIAGHEISHASGRNRKTIIHWKVDEKQNLSLHDVYSSSGFQKEDESGVKGSAIEHGLAVLDAKDMYDRYLKKFFPKDARVNEEMIQTRSIKKQLQEEMSGIFGPISASTAEPFVGKIKMPGILNKLSPAVIDSDNLHAMRFAQELCRTLGASIARRSGVSEELWSELRPDIGMMNPLENERSDDYFTRVGRTLLDKERFIDGYDKGTRTIEAVFGQNASVLLKADDKKKNSVEPGMRVVRAKQKQLGMAA